ncbi:hypothetical protein FRB90_007791 [Tulasnella sp. 427]|nr:hypothetical protein FRB90_007791 [Tulasnella sp. 427]
MHFLLRPHQARSSGSLRRSLLTTTLHRHGPPSLNIFTSARRLSSTLTAGLSEFEHLGLTPAVMESLQAAFPHVKTPSQCQRGLIPAVLQPNSHGAHRDVLLRGDTGSGKSFALALALLSKPRQITSYSPKTRKNETKPQTQLIIVPHRELAYQYHHWLSVLTSSSPELADHRIQLCVRGDPNHPLPRHLLSGTPEHLLRSSKVVHPSIVVATPPALVELLEGTRVDRLGVNLSTVLVDEVDAMLALPPKDASKKEIAAWNRHVPPVIQILNAIYGTRDDGDGFGGRSVGLMPRPQLVLTSATLNAHVRGYIFTQTNWLKRPGEERRGTSVRENELVVKLDYAGTPLVSSGAETTPADLAGKSLDDGVVKHSCVVVNESGESRNIDMEAEEVKEPFQPLSKMEKKRAKEEREKRNEQLRSKSAAPTSPSNLIQALAVQFALDVPSLALLVVPSTSNVRKIVEEFQELGVQAESVELADAAKGRSDLVAARPSSNTNSDPDTPRLLISNLSNTRGLDFPSLTHVFVMGTDVVKTPSDYTHIAGRVGRFGKGGHVVTFVEGGVEEGSSSVDEGRMKRMFKKLGIDPTMVELESV